MAKTTKKKTKVSKKSARMTAKSSAKVKAAKKTAKPAKKPAARKAARKIDPLNRKQYTSVTPMLTVRDIARAVDFYTNAFGFKSRGIMNGPDGAPMHAELRLRDTTVMLGPEFPQQQSFGARSIGGTPVTLYVLVDDVDATFNKAVASGGQVLMPVMDMFWGDRVGLIADPEGNKWMVATHKAEYSPAQMDAKMKEQFSAMNTESAAAAAGGESQY